MRAAAPDRRGRIECTTKPGRKRPGFFTLSTWNTR